MSAFYTIGRHTVAPVLRGLWRPWTAGLEHIPASGPAILASNHLSACDSLFLPVVSPREITFWAKAEYFAGDGVKGRLTAAFMRGVRQIGAPVPRLGHTLGVRVGAPLDYTDRADGPRNPKLLREITDDIMTRIRRLSGQEYVDRYASRDKATG